MTSLGNLAELRALRDSAWAVVKADLAALGDELEERGIGERVKDKAVEEAQDAWGQAVDIAADNKGVVAATVLALLAWFFRGPIGAFFEALVGERETDAEPDARTSVESGEGEQS